MSLSRDIYAVVNVFAGVLLLLSRNLYDSTDRDDSGCVLWHFEVELYFGPKVSELVDSFPVKVLPREKDALDPGFELEYNTPSTVAASGGNEESTSKDAPRVAHPEALLQGIY